MSKPDINVTPLIDVLLVLLIIFMIVAPQKPTDIKTKIPQESKDSRGQPHPLTLVVAVNSDSSLRLNKDENIGTIQETGSLTEKLKQTFIQRTENHVYSDSLARRNDIPESEKIEKTVFIKAPRTIDYGSVAKVIDAVKISGANPVSLQIDDLE